jgi:3-isopropylmalate dehydrogenase
VSRRRRYTVACLSGRGIGPEVMAEASRALAEVSRLHGFFVEEVHAPFGDEALAAGGHPLPPATRAATSRADAILVAAMREPALAGVKAQLDLAASVTAVRLRPGGDVTIFAPLAEGAEGWTVERAFAAARARRGRLTSVGTSPEWRQRVEAAAGAHEGVVVRHLTLAEALPVLSTHPSRADVLVTERVLAGALAEVPQALPGGTRIAASGALSPNGPGVFGPTHGPAHDIAGQGVANPSEMLLAAALMLAEGLGRRSAAQTLESGIASALGGSKRTMDLVGTGVAATTREFVDVVLSLLPSVRVDTEFEFAPEPAA